MPFANALNELAEKTKNNSKINENDYKGADGLLYCGFCKTPKQVRVEFLGMERTPFCMCKCETERRETEEKARADAERAKVIDRLRYEAFPDCKESAGQDEDMKQWTFSNDNNSQLKISQAAKKYVENFAAFRKQGKGLLFYGTVGTGKSYIAACIANALIDKEYPVLMTNFARIRNEVQGSFSKQEYFNSLNEYALLIIDDLAAESKTEYMQEIVFNVIDSRYRANLPLIVTSNLTGQEMKNPADIGNKRIFSRVLKMCHPVKFEGEDQRQKKAVEGFAEMQRQLGL